MIDYSRIDDLKVVFQKDKQPEIVQTQKYFGVKNEEITYYENEEEPVVGTSLIIQVELSSEDDSDDDDDTKLKACDNVFQKMDEIENPGSRKSERIKVIGKTNFQYVLKRKAWLSKRKTNELKLQNTKNLRQLSPPKYNRNSLSIKKEELHNHAKTSKLKRLKPSIQNGNNITMKYEIMADNSNQKDDDPVQGQEITDSSH